LKGWLVSFTHICSVSAISGHKFSFLYHVLERALNQKSGNPSFCISISMVSCVINSKGLMTKILMAVII
jgi:hypothetical protein